MMDVAFVDTETTGLDPDRHEIWEVGLIYPMPLKNPDGSVSYVWEEKEWQLPVNLGAADPMGLKISGFHDRYSPSWHRNMAFEVIPKFATEFAELTRGKHLAGAVVSFDEERLRRLIRASGECPMWHYHLIDVETLAVGFLCGQHGSREGALDALPMPWDSEDLSRAVGVNPDHFDRHTAIGDAQWAKALYEAVTGPWAQ